jgi:hypothetical protein
MMNLFGFNVGLMRKFWRIEIAYVFAFFVYSYLSQPFVFLFAPANSSISAGVAGIWVVLVLHILLVSRQSQIANPIICLDFIDVVNCEIRKTFVSQIPSNSVCLIQLCLVPKNYIASVVDATNRFLEIFSSVKQSSVCVVNKTCKINIVHAVAPSCNGLRSNGLMLTHQAVAPL